MKVHELLSLPKTAYLKGFKLKNGRVIWSDVHVSGDRKCIRISRMEAYQVFNSHDWKTIVRYVKPHTEVEIIS
jgi:hypothetical protein